MEGMLVIVSGLSGAGKTTIVEKSIAQSGVGTRIITCTTRKPREGEVDGTDYRFLSQEEFARKLAAGEFAEHARVYENFYGTLLWDIDIARETFPIAYLIIDVQGAQTLMPRYPEARSVFVRISRKEVKRRLAKRGEDDSAIRRRLDEVDRELNVTDCFDKVLSNRMGRVDTTVREFLDYVTSCRAIKEIAAT